MLGVLGGEDGGVLRLPVTHRGPVLEPTSPAPDADILFRSIDVGVKLADVAAAANVTHVWCAVTDPDLRCPGCGEAGAIRDHVVRELVDLPISSARTVVHVRIPRLVYEQCDCVKRIYRAGTDQLAAARSKVTRRVAKWILQRLVLDRMSVNATSVALGLSWGTVNTIALAAARELTCSPAHLAGVRELGVREHKWKHVRGNGDSSWVTARHRWT